MPFLYTPMEIVFPSFRRAVLVHSPVWFHQAGSRKHDFWMSCYPFADSRLYVASQSTSQIIKWCTHHCFIPVCAVSWMTTNLLNKDLILGSSYINDFFFCGICINDHFEKNNSNCFFQVFVLFFINLIFNYYYF